MPVQHYLRKDAKFILTGSISILGEFYDNLGGPGSYARDHFTPNPNSSALFGELCRAGGDSRQCTFPSVVYLNRTLTCDGSTECTADTLRVVKIVDPSDGIIMYYHYEEPACVHFAFFDDGHFISNFIKQCADPTLVTIAGTPCCNENDEVVSSGGEECLYLAEAMTYVSAKARCAALYNATTCSDNPNVLNEESHLRTDDSNASYPEWAQTCAAFQYRWTSASCEIKVKVDFLGKVTIVDEPTWWNSHLQAHSGNSFRVVWNQPTQLRTVNDTTYGLYDEQQKFPLYRNGTCDTSGCELYEGVGGEGEESCFCSLWVETTLIYTNASEPIPTPTELRAVLFIGAAAPSMGYSLCTTRECVSQAYVSVYTKGNDPSPTSFDQDTIFELTDALGWRTKSRYLLNRVSTVFVGAHADTEMQHEITACTASTVYTSYSCTLAIDTTSATQWIMHGASVGQWINLTFSGPPITLNRMIFQNRAGRWNKDLRLEFSDGSEQHVQVPEGSEAHSLAFITQVTTSFVRIVVESVYFSTSYTGAVDIKFYGPMGAHHSFNTGGFNFRNAPNFNPNVGAYPITYPLGDKRYLQYDGWELFKSKAMHEVEALIDHLVEHPNTGPFVALRLIQRLVTSNPSPRYIKAVSTAFSNGCYGNYTFSGKYGDMAATVTAILLDREARSAVLEADPTFGQLREPLLKLLHMMRSMEHVSKPGVEIMLERMGEIIGQGSFQQASVFSFYDYDFAPDGPVSDRGLVSPEHQLFVAPNVIGYLDGMDSLIQYGLTSCQDGFGDLRGDATRSVVGGCEVGEAAKHADGALSYTVPIELQEVSHIASSCSASIEMSVNHLYQCFRALDNGGGTWASSGGAIGSWIVLEVAGGEPVLINKLLFRNRCDPDMSKRVRLDFSDGSQQTVTLEDSCVLETYELTAAVNTSWVRIYVETVYTQRANGAINIYFKHDDTTIALDACTASGAHDASYASSCSPPDVTTMSTEWATQSNGVDSWVRVGGFENGSVVINKMRYSNSCGENRNKRLRLDFNDGTNQTVEMSNSCEESVSIASVNTTEVLVTVESVYSIEESVCCVCPRAYKRYTRDLTGLQTSVCEGAIGSSGVIGGASPDIEFLYAVDGSTTSLIDDIGMLLTPGRLSTETRASIVEVYNRYTGEQSLKQALKMFAIAPEFHVTNQPRQQHVKRVRPAAIESENRPYKAVVVVILKGGADSFNMVVPHSSCTVPSAAGAGREAFDLYAEYAEIRKEDLTIPKDNLLQVDILDDSDPQPCATFGLHPILDYLKEAYDDKDAVILSNIGAMVEPMTIEDYYTRRQQEPLGNFGHGGMGRACQSIDASEREAKGILGKMAAKLTTGDNPMKTSLYSASGHEKILEGAMTPSMVNPESGVQRYKNYGSHDKDITKLLENSSTSIFAETFASQLEDILTSTELLGGLIDATTLATTDTFGHGMSLGAQFREVAKLIAVDNNDLHTERSGFVLTQDAYDTHGDFDTLESKLNTLDNSLKSFSDEMKAQGLWDNVAVVVISEFGRTLTSNTLGTDHGWGGNYFLLGGDVRGGRMVGTFPERLAEGVSDVNLGRGRILPTKPWEALWSGVTEWFGLGVSDRADVLPLARNWPEQDLFNKSHLFI